MSRTLVPIVGLVVLLAAVGAGVGVWFALGGGGGCDADALREVVREGVAEADRQGLDEFTPEFPAGCDEADLRAVLHDVTHEWHVMPGGSLMRGASHGQ
ncbi:MAG TPA: hypothetical protein VNM43_06320 [Dehalococcoidia bacterium]|nr:hypothetical protein [Dehalococcoidia bacterium]